MLPSARRFVKSFSATIAAQRTLHRLLAILTLTFSVYGATPSLADIPAAERAVLVSLYNSTGGAAWTNTTAATSPWTVAAAPGNECAWYGVVCAVTSPGNHTVTQLNLQANNLVGTLPADLSSLASLQYLRAQQNTLSGALPSLAGMSALEYFDVRDNQLTGNLPQLSSLAALRVFSFENNQIEGAIPPLAGLSALEVFWGTNNQLTGTIPPLSGLGALTLFYVDSNQLSGVIPSLDGLLALEGFYAGFNQLTGAIPSLSDLIALRYFRVENNQLTGGPPSLAGLDALLVYQIKNNQISGPVAPVPAPTNSLVAGLSGLCPNQLLVSADVAWDAATGASPWSTGCTAPLIAQTLNFDAAPLLVLGGTGTVAATSIPTPGSTAAIAYSSLTPTICSVNGSSGLVTVLAAAVDGSVCTIAADKAGDATHNTAAQVQQNITIATLINGACGSANSVATLTAPTTNLCAPTSVASAVATAVDQFSWTCNGANGGTNASCAAPRAYTVTASVSGGNGTAMGGGVVVYNGTGLVTIMPNAGFAIATPVGGTCDGTLNANIFTTSAIVADCTVIASFVAVTDAACGSANGVAVAVAPTASLCAAGTATAVASLAGQFTWTCTGANGGANAACAAPRTYAVTPSVAAGGNGSINPSVPQTVVAGGSAVFMITPNPGYSIAGVGGSCGGVLVGNTYTTNPVTAADCSVIVSFASAAAQPVPTLTTWMALLLMLLLAAQVIARRAVTRRSAS